MFNERVVREALLNAVSHRNYQLGGSIFIRQYHDRLVIESPGGFPLGVTPDNIINKCSPRNRRITEILDLSGSVERSGQGMDLIYELSIKEAKSLPDFTGTDDFLVRITLNGLIREKGMLSLIKKIGTEQLKDLSTDDLLVINILFHEQKLPDRLHPSIEQLISKGIIEDKGRSKYVLARSLGITDKTDVHTRLEEDRDKKKKLFIKHLGKKGTEGTPFNEFYQVLPKHKRSQIQVLLRELKKEKKIRVAGSTSAAKWYISTP
jgi:ATP-dependent DNA helicase RecG